MSEKITDADRALAAEHGLDVQAMPEPTGARSSHDLVIEDMERRKGFGLVKYGTLLQHDSGRNHLLDAYEEVLDLAVYLRSQIEHERALAGTELASATTDLYVARADPLRLLFGPRLIDNAETRVRRAAARLRFWRPSQ